MRSLFCVGLCRYANHLLLLSWVGLTLSFSQLWDEEEEEIADLSVMGATESVDAEDPLVIMEDIFGISTGSAIRKNGLPRCC